jgi:Fic family protein
MHLDELTQLKAQLDRLRPIPPEKMEAIDEKLTIEWTYNSNAIEGNTLSLEETAFFLKRGLTVQGKSLVEHLEARNHVEAIQSLKDVVEKRRPLTEGLIKELHALLLRGIEWMWIGLSERRMRKPTRPGQYKVEPNHVVRLDGKIHSYCEPLKVPDEMERLLKFYAENKSRRHPVELAAEMHYGLVQIHPFADGNGRVARLLMNLILMESSYPPAVIRSEKRQEYYQALMAADEGDLSGFVALAATEVERTIRMMIEILERPISDPKENISEHLSRLDAGLGRANNTERESK